MLCKNCGKELADSALMCPNCGAPTENWQKIMPVAANPSAAESAPKENPVATTGEPRPTPAVPAATAPAPATPTVAPPPASPIFHVPNPSAPANAFRTPAQKSAPKGTRIKEPLTVIGFILSVLSFVFGFILITCAFAVGEAAGFLAGSMFLSTFILLPAFAGFALSLYGLLTAKSRLGKAFSVTGTVLTSVIVFYYFLGLVLGFML